MRGSSWKLDTIIRLYEKSVFPHEELLACDEPTILDYRYTSSA
jgi:hypothetical protein